MTLAAFLALGAFKLLPGIEDCHEYRRNYYIRLDHWWETATRLVIPWRHMPGSPQDNFPEHYLYIGWAGVLACVWALSDWRRSKLPLLAVVVAVVELVNLPRENPVADLPILATQGSMTRFALVGFVALGAAAATRIDERWTRWARSASPRRRAAIQVLGLAFCVVLTLDLRRSNVADPIAMSCHDELPRADGPFDVAPAFVPVTDGSAVIRGGPVTADTFRYEFEQRAGIDDSVVTSADLPTKTRTPHLRLMGEGSLIDHQGRLGVRLRGPRGSFTLFFYDPWTWIGLALSLVGWCAWAGLGAWVLVSERRRGPIGELPGACPARPAAPW